ncbi:unnamed protein product [Echinostoma caproni]|uniref:G-patch domain-containing protein n=1 Tax=Echinostoma caproni TaxID=27848 RepID=A0A3P8C7F3_9TREM|nr:unnamed protein product [Echinostoma caproni]
MNLAKSVLRQRAVELNSKKGRTLSRTEEESKRRTEGLEKKVEPTNKGFNMLVKMGYAPGKGLGKNAEGRAEPVPIEVRSSRSGLGRDAAERERKEAIQRIRQHLVVTERNQFLDVMSTKFRLSRAKRQLEAARRICLQLDSAQSIPVPVSPAFWPTPDTPKPPKSPDHEFRRRRRSERTDRSEQRSPQSNQEDRDRSPFYDDRDQLPQLSDEEELTSLDADNPKSLEVNKFKLLGKRWSHRRSPTPTDQTLSLDPVERMLANLIIHEEAHFRHQTRDEKPLSDFQKLSIARELYSQKPGIFLERFSRYLDWSQDRINFTKWHSSDDLVGYLMDKLDREAELNNVRKSKVASCRVRNRRLNALYRAARGDNSCPVSDHFTHEAMRQRDPVLWEEMIGQHLDEPTRRRYLDREYQTFAGYLHGQLIQQEEKRMFNQARYKQRANKAKYDDDDESDFVDPVPETIEDREREFLDLMKLRFLSGQDKSFNYQ